MVSLYMNQAILGQTQSRGVLMAPHTSYEACLKARDSVRQQWHLDGYRISPRCVYVKHYSTNNGAYNSETK